MSKATTCQQIKKIFSFTLSVFRQLGRHVVTVMKIVQKCSAPYSFRSKLNSDTYSLFRWAHDFVSLITHDILKLESLSQIDPILLYAYGFFLAFPFLFIANYKSPQCVLGMFLTAIWLTFLGYSFISHIAIVGIYLSVSIFVVALAFTLVFVSKSRVAATVVLPILMIPSSCVELMTIERAPKVSNENGKDETDRIEPKEPSKLTIITGFIMMVVVYLLITTPVYLKKNGICIFVLCMTYVIVILVVLIIILSSFLTREIVNFIFQLYGFLTSITIIPIIQNLTRVNNYLISSWQIMTYISVVPIFSTFFLTILLTVYKYEKVLKKYRDYGYYYYFEIFAVAHDYIYAILAGFNIFWGCFSIELIFLILIVVLRPYRHISDMAVQIGQAVLVMLINLLSEFLDTLGFTLSQALAILFACFFPMIVALYIYFIFEFDDEKQEDALLVQNPLPIIIINIFCAYEILLGFLLYGMSFYQIYGVKMTI